MAAFNFPASPSNGDNYTLNGVTYQYDGTKWVRFSSSVGAQGATGSTGPSGPTGAQGAQGLQGAQAHISTSAPSSGVSNGDLWWDSDGGDLSIYYNDGSSAQWVDINTGPRGAQGGTGPTGAQGAAGAQGALATINSNTNNYVLTATGTSNTIQGEANLTFDGSTLGVAGNIFIGDSNRIYIGGSNDAYIYHDTANTHFVNGTGHLLFRQTANSDVVIQSNNTDRFRIYNDGVVAIGQSSKSSTVGAGNLDIQGNATSCIIEMGNPFPAYSGGVVPEFRITATNSSHTVDFESVWGGDNLLHKHLAFSGGSTRFYRGTNSDEIARFNNADFGIGTQSPSDKLHVNGGDIIISTTNAPNLRLVKADNSSGNSTLNAFFGIATGNNNFFNGTVDNDLCIVAPTNGRIHFGYANSIKLRMENDGTLFSAATYNNTTASGSRSVVMPNNTGEFFASTSSRRFKTNITTLTDALADKILECRPVSFNSTCAADNKSKIYYGLIAEEVHEIDTSLVAYEDENAETPVPAGVQYDRFVPHLINLVKRQKAQIATLEAKVAALEGS